MKKAKSKTPSEKKTVHFVFIEESLDKVAAELMKWDEALWWPKNPGIQIKRQAPGAIQVGSTFSYKLPMVPAWTAEVTTFVPQRILVNTFKSKFLRGGETVRIEERANGTKVEYEISYQINGLLNTILWILLGEKPYGNAMKKILAGFKAYVIEKSTQDRERKFEGSS
jgi:hypothetical protein